MLLIVGFKEHNYGEVRKPLDKTCFLHCKYTHIAIIKRKVLIYTHASLFEKTECGAPCLTRNCVTSRYFQYSYVHSLVFFLSLHQDSR